MIVMILLCFHLHTGYCQKISLDTKVYEPVAWGGGGGGLAPGIQLRGGIQLNGKI